MTTTGRATNTDYETAWMLLATLGTHAPEVLTEDDRDTISQAVDELTATVGEEAGALFALDVTTDPRAVLAEVDRRLTRLLTNTGRPADTDHLTRCKDLLATIRVR